MASKSYIFKKNSFSSIECLSPFWLKYSQNINFLNQVASRKRIRGKSVLLRYNRINIKFSWKEQLKKKFSNLDFEIKVFDLHDYNLVLCVFGERIDKYLTQFRLTLPSATEVVPQDAWVLSQTYSKLMLSWDIIALKRVDPAQLSEEKQIMDQSQTSQGGEFVNQTQRVDRPQQSQERELVDQFQLQEETQRVGNKPFMTEKQRGNFQRHINELVEIFEGPVY